MVPLGAHFGTNLHPKNEAKWRKNINMLIQRYRDTLKKRMMPEVGAGKKIDGPQ